MSNNVLEQEIRRLAFEICAKFRAHDRGVLIGFAFSLLPVFPLAFIGLCVGFFHLFMYRTGRLSGFDHELSKKGLFFAVINCILSLIIVWATVQFASSYDWSSIGGNVVNHIRDAINFFWGHITPALNRKAVVV